MACSFLTFFTKTLNKLQELNKFIYCSNSLFIISNDLSHIMQEHLLKIKALAFPQMILFLYNAQIWRFLIYWRLHGLYTLHLNFLLSSLLWQALSSGNSTATYSLPHCLLQRLERRALIFSNFLTASDSVLIIK